MIIGLFPNKLKKETEQISKQISEYLTSRGVKVVAEEESAAAIHAAPLSSVALSEIDFALSLGGDGTLLQLVHRYPEIDAPIMPINLGSLGFMADITKDEIFPSLQNLLEEKYSIQKRMMMEGFSIKGKRHYALNEIAVHRAANRRLVDLAIYLDDRYLNTFSADGILISTPTGSTAYSLAAGGPILTPELEAFILTPICPHTISNRPIVFMPQQEVRVEYMNAYDPVEISYDGFYSYPLCQGEPLKVMRSARSFKLVCMPNHDYFSTLRTKLGWSGKLRNF